MLVRVASCSRHAKRRELRSRGWVGKEEGDGSMRRSFQTVSLGNRVNKGESSQKCAICQMYTLAAVVTVSVAI